MNVGDEVQLKISIEARYVTRTAKIRRVNPVNGGGIHLAYDGGLVHLDAREAKSMGIEVEIPKKVIWVSVGGGTSTTYEKPPKEYEHNWTKYEEVRD